MSLKKHLKAAKAAIDQRDGRTALECVEQVLEIDPLNYFGLLFRARAHQLLHHQKDAEEAFEAAIAVEPDNLLGWRGYLQALKTGDNHDRFFQVLNEIVPKLDLQNELLQLIPKDIYAYLHRHKYKANAVLHELFLRSILPDMPLGAILGSSFSPPLETIQTLIHLVKTREDLLVNGALLREKLKLPQLLTPAMRASLNSVEYKIREKLDLPHLYELFSAYCDDDDRRRQNEVDNLRYKYNLLRTSPQKEPLSDEVKEMAADLVLLGAKDIFPWTLHLNFQDVESLAALDPQLVLQFLRNFKNEPLGLVLYLFVMSELSPFDKTYFKELESLRTTSSDDEEDDIEDADPEAKSDSTSKYTQAEIMAILVKGYKKCSSSVLAHRIVAQIDNFYGEYALSSRVCSDGIRLIATLQEAYGMALDNSKEDLTCQLAMVYTYHEAPKNFGRALQIFDKILEASPQNEQALIGKGLILIEKGEYTKAQELLQKVVADYPSNSQALNDLGWCYILQEQYEKGKVTLSTALDSVVGVSSKAFDLRASISWRMATGYIRQDSGSVANVKTAYDLLVTSLSKSKFHAPSYTLLGTILQDFYGDKARAQKCFYKAFELDVAEITAAKYLVTELCSKRDWDVTEILCLRVVESEKSRKFLFSRMNTDSDRLWPYRVLGCSALNKQDDGKAIEWFQTALRMQAMDIECWTGLGEAYYNCGRIDAAIKVFQHTIEMPNCTWVNHYMLGQAVCDIGDYPSGLELLNKALSMNPEAECITSAIYEQCILYCELLLQGGFVGRVIENIKKAIETIAIAAKVNSDSYTLWKALGDCVGMICRIQQNISEMPFETVFNILSCVEDIDDTLANVVIARRLLDQEEFADCVAMLGVLAAKAALSRLKKRENKLVRSAVLFNLGLAYTNAFHVSHQRNTQMRDQAIIALKEAIRVEPQNAQYWLALGNAYVTFNPALLQHSFIKASVLDSKEVTPWTNLAALYLRYGDAELAMEAFDRATSVAPELAKPWLGKALAADALGDSDMSSHLTTHAQILSNGTDPLAQLCYAIVVVDKHIQKSSNARDVVAAQEVSVANAAIRRFLKFEPDHVAGLKLAFLLSERCHTYDISVDIGQALCRVLEKEYEKTELEQLLGEFALAKAQLARVYLGCERYDEAIEHSQLTLELLLEADQGSEDVARAKLSARIVTGLSFFFNGQYNDALEEFQVILDEHSLSHRAVTLIAQILYAIDSEESKKAAIDHLFAFIEEHGSSLMVVMALGVISLAERYNTYFEAIKDELEGLLLTELLADLSNAVPRILHELNQEIGRGNARVWQKFAMMFPSDFKIWNRLDTHMALSSSLLSEAKASAPEVAAAYVAKKTRREVQRSLLVYSGNAEARSLFIGQ